MNGDKHYLDFLCLLDDGKVWNIEFQFPKARPDDLDRFFDYNIIVQVTLGSMAETIVIDFISKKYSDKIRAIGECKCFNSKYVHLGDIDYDGYWRNINMKAESNLKLTSFEEIALLLTCLMPACENKAQMLDKISKLLKNVEMFDETRFEYIQAIIKLEIDNLISDEERDSIAEVIDMSPEAERIISQAITEVHKKSVHDARLDGRKEGRKEVARNLKGVMDDEEISRISGLSLEKVRQL